MLDRLTRRYLDEVACDPGATRTLVDGLLASPRLHEPPFSGRLLSRPSFLEGPDKHQLESDILGVYDLLASLPRRLFAGDLERYGRAVGVGPAQAGLALRMASDWPPLLLGRADLYRDDSGFKLLELNLGSPIGGFQAAELNRVMMGTGAVRAFVEREGLGYVDTMPILAGMLRARRGAPSRPVVALTEWPDGFAKWEPTLRALAAQFQELGIDARPCHVGQLRERGGGGLTVQGTRVDIVFRHFTMAEIAGHPEGPALVEPLVRAHELGAVEMFAPLSTTLIGNKHALALLCDERHRPAFSRDELALIDRFLPWTRELRDGPIHVDGAEVSLRDLCRQSKDRLILKPGHLYGGLGIHTGWTSSEREWRTALADAWNGPYVVQERVVPTPDQFPDVHTGELEPWILNWGVFVTGHGYSGCFLRGSRRLDDGVVNFDRGASVGTCFHSAGTQRPERTHSKSA